MVCNQKFLIVINASFLKIDFHIEKYLYQRIQGQTVMSTVSNKYNTTTALHRIVHYTHNCGTR